MVREKDLDPKRSAAARALFGAGAPEPGTAAGRMGKRDAGRYRRLFAMLRQAEAQSRDPERAEWGKAAVRDQTVYTAQKGTYGPWGSIAKNACGSIAAHNALIILGCPLPFARAYAYFHALWPWGTALGGVMGTNPLAVRSFLKGQGCKTKIYLRPGSVPPTHGAYIVLYLWRKKGMGAHYAALRYDAARQAYAAYNDEAAEVSDFMRMRARDGVVWMAVLGVDR